MSTGQWVIQGYEGAALVNEQRRIIVNAEPHCEVQATHLLEPIMERTEDELKLKASKMADFPRRQTSW